MLDAITQQPAMQRAQGAAMASFRLRQGRSKLADLRQAGSAKLLFPRTTGTIPELVLLNTSGGLTGGDRLALTLDLGADCQLLATTQTAERAYCNTGLPAQVHIRATLGPGARLDWLPQETILYQDSQLTRRTEIDLDADASCLLSETLILGRKAMGEVVTRAHLTDHRMVRRAGRPVWADSFTITPDTLAADSPALLNGATALAVICLVAQGAEDAVGPLRDALDPTMGAVSGWDGKCVIRLAARDAWALKRQLAKLLKIISGRALPRVWASGGLE